MYSRLSRAVVKLDALFHRSAIVVVARQITPRRTLGHQKHLGVSVSPQAERAGEYSGTKLLAD
jgi:hypothetical protein